MLKRKKKNYFQEEIVTDPEILRQIKKAKKKEKKRLKALQLSLNCTGDDSVLTSDGSMLGNDTSVVTNESMNNTINTSCEGLELDNSTSDIIKKKKKKKKNKSVSSHFNI